MRVTHTWSATRRRAFDQRVVLNLKFVHIQSNVKAWNLSHAFVFLFSLFDLFVRSFVRHFYSFNKPAPYLILLSTHCCSRCWYTCCIRKKVLFIKLKTPSASDRWTRATREEMNAIYVIPCGMRCSNDMKWSFLMLAPLLIDVIRCERYLGERQLNVCVNI